MFLQRIPCQFCGSMISLNEDNRLTDIRLTLDNPDMIGWCSNCGTFYSRKVNTPLAERWEVPHYAKQFAKQAV